MQDVTYDIVTSTPLSEFAPNFFCGIIYGRHVTLEYLPNRNMLEMRLGTSDISKPCINRLRSQLSKYFNHPSVQMQFDEHTICAIIEAKEGWLDFITHLIDVIDEACVSQNLQSGCFVCGQNSSDIAPNQIGAMRAYMCCDCADRINQEMRDALKEKHENSRFSRYAHSNTEIHENFFMGILGASAGMLAGSILWFFLHRIPYVGYAICGFLLAFLILFGYKVLASSISVKGLLSCVGIILLAFILCFNVTQSVYIFQTLQGSSQTDLGLGSIIFSFFSYFVDDRFRDKLIDDFMIGMFGATIAFAHRFFVYYRKS